MADSTLDYTGEEPGKTGKEHRVGSPGPSDSDASGTGECASAGRDPAETDLDIGVDRIIPADSDPSTADPRDDVERLRDSGALADADAIGDDDAIGDRRATDDEKLEDEGQLDDEDESDAPRATSPRRR